MRQNVFNMLSGLLDERLVHAGRLALKGQIVYPVAMYRPQRPAALLMAFFTISLMGAGCQVPATEPIPGPSLVSSEGSQIQMQTWQKNPSGFESLTITDESGDEIGTMYAFDPALFHFGFEIASSGKSIVEWMAYSTSAVAVINGVYFHDDESPSGLLVHKGAEFSTRHFSADKSSVIRLSPKPAILDSADEIASGIASKEAAQSYPLLLEDKKPQVAADTGNKAQRSFIGFRDDEHVVLGVIMKKELSLYELSQLLAKKDYRLNSALNLDGGSSSGLYSRDEETMSYNSLFPVPNVISVYRRSE
jgi:uncharacterized protein YigE (DUF2233 family)